MRKVGREEALGLLRDWGASGEPMSTWCAQRGINWYSLSAFKGWGVRGGDLVFAEVVPLSAPTAPTTTARYRVEVGAVTIEVGDDFQTDTLQRLVRAVAAC